MASFTTANLTLEPATLVGTHRGWTQYYSCKVKHSNSMTFSCIFTHESAYDETSEDEIFTIAVRAHSPCCEEKVSDGGKCTSCTRVFKNLIFPQHNLMTWAHKDFILEEEDFSSFWLPWLAPRKIASLESFVSFQDLEKQLLPLLRSYLPTVDVFANAVAVKANLPAPASIF